VECRTLSAASPCGHCQSSSCLDIVTRADVRNAFRLLCLVPPRDIAVAPEIGRALQAALRMAISDATLLQDELVTSEHLLAGLLQDPRCVELLKASGATVERLKQRLNAFLAEDGRPRRKTASKEPVPSPEIQQVLQEATVHALSIDNDVVEASDALIALCGQKSSRAGQLLADEAVVPDEIIKAAAR
jgi:ATP-dependent Clp protease ATP-binding subunit ClpA